MHGWCLKLILPTDTSLNSQSPVYFEEIHTNINLQKIRQLLFYLSSISNFMRANYPKQALNQQICLLPALGGFCAPQSSLCLAWEIFWPSLTWWLFCVLASLWDRYRLYFVAPDHRLWPYSFKSIVITCMHTVQIFKAISGADGKQIGNIINKPLPQRRINKHRCTSMCNKQHSWP